ncbi:MAG: CAP domain-containing protein [Candidatus Pristimantibacillus sp.]
MQFLRKSSTMRLKKVVILLLLFVVLNSFVQVTTISAAASFTDTKGHWAETYISWADEHKLISGYEDGSFQPNRNINEAEFLALLLRAYDKEGQAAQGAPWYEPYYTYATDHGWPVAYVINNGTFNRGQAALLLASAATSKLHSEESAIQWLLDEKITEGRTSSTVAGFVANGTLTRAEALTFIYRLKLHTAVLSNQVIPQQSTNAGLNGVQLNDTSTKVLSTLGEPARTDQSENTFVWNVYNDKYETFSMIGVQDNKVVALFSNAPTKWTFGSTIKIGALWTDAKKSLGSTKISTNDDYITYDTSGIRNTLFLDRHDKDRIIGMMQIKISSLKASDSKSSNLQTAYELELFDLTNAERSRRSLPTLQWDKAAAASARAHSVDMAKRNFFDHTNPDGESPFDRMKQQKISYSYASENISAGYANAIYAYFGWINSAGHRANLLSEKIERLGTGVQFGGSYGIYYTQNFYTP